MHFSKSKGNKFPLMQVPEKAPWARHCPEGEKQHPKIPVGHSILGHQILGGGTQPFPAQTSQARLKSQKSLLEFSSSSSRSNSPAMGILAFHSNSSKRNFYIKAPGFQDSQSWEINLLFFSGAFVHTLGKETEKLPKTEKSWLISIRIMHKKGLIQ